MSDIDDAVITITANSERFQAAIVELRRVILEVDRVFRGLGWKPGKPTTAHWLIHHAKKRHPPVKANRHRVHRRRRG